MLHRGPRAPVYKVEIPRRAANERTSLSLILGFGAAAPHELRSRSLNRSHSRGTREYENEYENENDSAYPRVLACVPALPRNGSLAASTRAASRFAQGPRVTGGGRSLQTAC